MPPGKITPKITKKKKVGEQENVLLTAEESALLKELEDNFKSAASELRKACARNNISAPPFTLNEICDLYA